jgi:hypothetical protein
MTVVRGTLKLFLYLVLIGRRGCQRRVVSIFRARSVEREYRSTAPLHYIFFLLELLLVCHNHSDHVTFCFKKNSAFQ